MLETNKIYHANCFELFSSIADSSIDMILTDPPYSTTKLKFDTDSSIDFDLLFSEFKRMLKPNGWVFMFGTLQMFASTVPYFKEKFTYIWLKNNFILSSRSAVHPYKKHEYLFALVNYDVKPSKLTFHRDELRTYGHKPYSMVKRKRSDWYSKAIGAGQTETPAIKDRTYREGTSILEFKSNNSLSDKDKLNHPTAKPVDLLTTVIKGFSNERDLILDPFSGSGSTALACQANNRRYIGIELDKDYYAESVNKLKEKDEERKHSSL